MVRNHKRKRDGEPLCEAQVRAYVVKKQTTGISFRKAAGKGMSKSTLHRLNNKIDLIDPNTYKFKRSHHNRQVFTPKQECDLVDYLIVAQKLNHGLTPVDTRKLAYNYAKANQIKMPPSWYVKEEAGPDWFSLFIKRNQSLSIRKPERTSQARAAAVNHPVIDKFYDDLLDLYDKYDFPPEKIFNCDETNNPTVVDPQNIVAEKGAKAVSCSTGGEQGINVTMLAFVNAAGQAFPGVFVYPRKNVNLEKMVDLPEGFLPLAHPSGWMNEDLFLASLQHFKQQVVCSPEDPILLTMDNHISHIAYPVVEYCKTNGIVLLTLPPHTSHVLQPLDKGLFGPMKEDMKKEHRDWMRQHPGQRIGIYDVPRLTKGPYQRRFNVQNIKSSFAACGIWPHNPHAIPECMFVPSSVTDLPAVSPEETITTPLPDSQPTEVLQDFVHQESSFTASNMSAIQGQLKSGSYILTVDSSGNLTFTPTSTTSMAPLPSAEARSLAVNQGCPLLSTPSTSLEAPRQNVTPEEVLPHPRVAQIGPRITRSKNRGSSRVLTNSPEMARLKETYDAKVLKESNQLLKESSNIPKKTQRKARAPGGKAQVKSTVSAAQSNIETSRSNSTFADNDSSSLAPKKGRPRKKTTGLNKKAPCAKSNDENIPPDHVEQVLARPSSDHNIQRKPKSRAVKRQLF